MNRPYVHVVNKKDNINDGSGRKAYATEANPTDETTIYIPFRTRLETGVAVEGKLDTYRRHLWQREWEPPGV